MVIFNFPILHTYISLLWVVAMKDWQKTTSIEFLGFSDLRMPLNLSILKRVPAYQPSYDNSQLSRDEYFSACIFSSILNIYTQQSHDYSHFLTQSFTQATTFLIIYSIKDKNTRIGWIDNPYTQFSTYPILHSPNLWTEQLTTQLSA